MTMALSFDWILPFTKPAAVTTMTAARCHKSSTLLFALYLTTSLSYGRAFLPLPQLHYSASLRLPKNLQRRTLDSSSVTQLYERVWDTHVPDPGKDSTNIPPAGGALSSPEEAVGQAILRLGITTAPTVWTEFSRIGQENDVVNLGQGFPDWLPPKFAVDSLVEAVQDSAKSPHQYTRTAGHPALVQQLAVRYSKHLRREIDPFAEIAVTVGASQALYLSLQTIVQPGDEVILFEPFFDLYKSQVLLAGGTPVFVPLTFVPYDDSDDDVVTAGEWILEADSIKKTVTTKTKAIILNSPHNPTGKLFTRGEMEHVAAALELAHPACVVLSDEVYKYIVHSPPEERDAEESIFCRGHVHFASLPGMWDRTITISSAGKTFSATGWQVGWCVGPTKLISRIHQMLPYVQFCASTVIQEALARSLPRADEEYQGHASYYDFLRVTYTQKRDLLAGALTNAGFAVQDYNRTPGGGFFIFARIGKEIRQKIPPERLDALNSAAPGGVARQDWALCQWMAEEKGVLCIPASPFFSEGRAEAGASDDFVRVAFCKTDETIEAAAVALQAVRGDSILTEEMAPFVPNKSRID
jgi:kynurenine--oxoglutarate transaminase/cysteine-S-conjugate beta-lyase/glutamine--phenylpyruvate transaminase